MSLCEKHITDIIFENRNCFLKAVLCFLKFVLPKHLRVFFDELFVKTRFEIPVMCFCKKAGTFVFMQESRQS